MRCLGPAIIDSHQQIQLERGEVVTLRNRPEVVFADAAERAHVGDSFWVKEPWVLVTSARYDGPRNIERRVPGRYPLMLPPDDLKDWWHVFRKVPCAKDAVKQLKRTDSRAYLVITEILDGGFRCTPHMQNIDAYLNSLGSKAA